MITKITKLITEEENLEKATRMAYIFGNLMWNNDVGIYDAYEIEKLLIEKYSKKYCIEVNNTCEKDCIHVITTPYESGGHTRLMEKLSTMDCIKPDLIVVSPGKKSPELDEYFSRIYLIKPFDLVKDKIVMISSILCEYKKIILHIHPDDIVSVIAAGIARKHSKSRVFFVNHADHVFSFGSYVADIYFEISCYGHFLDKKKKIRGLKSFLGIPLDTDIHSIPKRTEKEIYLTAGSSFKFKPNRKNNGYELINLLNKILEKRKGSIIYFVGLSLHHHIWLILLKIKYWKRIKIFKVLNHSEYISISNECEVFIDSHPINGGTSLPEQFLQGKQCIGIMSSIRGYSPVELLKKENSEDCLNGLNVFDKYDEILSLLNSTNGYFAVKNRYLQAIENNQTSQNLLLEIFKDIKPSLNLDYFRGNKISHCETKLIRQFPVETKFLLSTLKGHIKSWLVLELYFKQVVKKILKYEQ